MNKLHDSVAYASRIIVAKRIFELSISKKFFNGFLTASNMGAVLEGVDCNDILEKMSCMLLTFHLTLDARSGFEKLNAWPIICHLNFVAKAFWRSVVNIWPLEEVFW